jgi:hypothetical protein
VRLNGDPSQVPEIALELEAQGLLTPFVALVEQPLEELAPLPLVVLGVAEPGQHGDLLGHDLALATPVPAGPERLTASANSPTSMAAVSLRRRSNSSASIESSPCVDGT